MIDLSDKAAAVLMSAKHDRDLNGSALYLINRTLGYKTWATAGKSGARAEIAELYRNGLVAEWFSPWSPPLYLTEKGLAEYKERADALERC